MDRGYAVTRKPHPKDTASIWSLLVFSYIHPYIRTGNRRDLADGDICKTWSKLDSKILGNKAEQLWNAQKAEKRKKSLLKLIKDCFWKKYLLLGFFQLMVKLIYITLTPYSVGKLVSYFKENQTEITKNEAWIYGGIVIFTNSAFLFYEHHYILMKNEMGLEIVTALSSLIYRKSLKLSPAKLSEISNGKIVTAITKDISHLEEVAYFMNDLWVELIQAVVVLYLLYIKLGASGIAGLSSVIFFVGVQLYVASLIYEKRKAANNKCDERLQLTQEVLTSIRVLKMYAWEKFFAKKIINSRKSEIRKLRSTAVLKFFTGFLGDLSNKLSFLFIILFYIWFGNNLTAEIVYYVTTLFYRLRRTIAYIIPYSTTIIAELMAGVGRLEDILTADEIEPIIQDYTSKIVPKIEFVSAHIGVDQTPILKDVNMKLKLGLNILLGPVGSGKSFLMKAILQECNLLDGKINIEGRVAYCPQNPWMFPSSIKQNILFGEPFNELKYKNVLDVCALSFDLNSLAEGDETILNDCGVNLSKGQQARVNIARALYKDTDIYIFDDSLSSLDSHVKGYIFRNSIQNYLKDKMVILATHDNKFIDKADNVIVTLDGTVTYCGKPTDIPYKITQSLGRLDEDLKESVEKNDEETKEIIDEEPCNEETELIAEIRSSSARADIYHETLHTGRIGWHIYKKYFSFGGGFMVFFVVFIIYALVETFSGLSEKLLSKWVLIEENMIQNLTDTLETSSTYQENYNETYSTVPILLTSGNVSNSSQIYFDDRHFYINWYTILIVSSCSLIFVATSLFFVFSLKVSKNMHKSMINKVLGAKMSFFDVNMSGNILNRFSKDLYEVDEWIPHIINDAINLFTMMISTGALIATVNTMFTVMTVILIMIFFLGCNYCIRPGRTLRRLAMASRSPVVGHLNSTLEGLVTIRAYGTQSILINEFDKHLNHVVATHHLFEISMRCLAFCLHMMSAAYISTLIIIVLTIEGDTSSNVGLAVTQSFVMSDFMDYGIRQWVMLESMMTNFQRAAEYTDIKQEMTTGQIVENWPTEGRVQYRNVSLTYRTNSETVLKNLNFVIEPREKIGIVGRTGAGKSSIIVTLFRLYEVQGDIIIDNVDIKTLSLEYLRNHIGIIPQDPILFSGSVRANLDPLKKYTDHEIWQALNAVNLKTAIEDLNEDVHKSGMTHSVGQRQLLCLARAIIRKTKIIILDEATANMDEETDRFILNKIDELFADCTTITVAHRLNSVMKCDRVFVMDSGEIVECDNPNVLLGNKDSIFYKMVHQQRSF